MRTTTTTESNIEKCIMRYLRYINDRSDRRDKGKQDIIIDLKTVPMDIHDLQALVDLSDTEIAD